MYRHIQNTSALVVVSVALSLPVTVHAGGYGASAVRDSNVANATATAKVPCPRLGQNVPANLAAQMDCGTATPRVAGERVRNTGGGLFGGHRIGAAPPANADDDTPVRRVRDTGPTGGGDGPTGDDGGDDPIEDGDDPIESGGGFTSKTDRFNELGISFDDFANQSEDFHQSFDDFVAENGPNGDWSSFNPPE